MRIIAGNERGRRIEAPEGLHTRPTLDRVRENLFNMLQGEVPESRVLDLFAGSGALALEALSRGAAFAVLADRDREAHRTEKRNIEALGFGDRTRTLMSEWEKTLETLRREGECFDLVFLDPPYALTDLTDLTERLKPLLAEDGWIVLEHRADTRPRTADGLNIVKDRKWGYCGVTIYEQLRDTGIL